MTRAQQLFENHREEIFKRTDRMFAVLMVLQYFAGIIAALWISPRTWAGTESSIHIHVWAAIILGGLILSLPVALAMVMPGKVVTRHVIAVAQMLDSALLIHLTGGRIETHFHVFGSLAFLAFYRDWRVLISASTVVAADHFIRGLYWPQSVYGVLSSSPWRWLEHAGWVVFEDIFIFIACQQSIREMAEIADRRALIEHVAQERAQNIAELQEARAGLKAALDEKNTFISICGHELKTPLTSMSLQAQLAKRVLKKGIDTALSAQNIEKIVDQSGSQIQRLLRLVEDLLDHSRIQMGKLTLLAEKVDLSELVREVVARCRPQADAAASILYFEEGDPIFGVWDSFRIEQVVTNLLINAIKYGAGNPIEISLERRDREAMIFVKDHGLGIPKANHEKIFQLFERVGSSPEITGLGLGLYITKSIVEKHGGSIRIDSEPGRGSTFIVTLPLEIPALSVESPLASKSEAKKALA